MNVDNTRPFQIRVDACRRGHGLGGVLLQQDEQGEWRPVSWWSRALSNTEKEYSPTELECKALHDIILYYDVYLQGVRFDVYTDHAALIYMVKAQTATNNGRLMRYLMDIQHYDFNLHYKQGKMHLDADAVSRLLKFGEVPDYHDADTLEWDKGPITEEEALVARDLAEKRTRRMQRAELRLLEKRRGREGELSGVAEVIMNGLRRGSEKRSDRQLRPRNEVTSAQKGRTAPGRDNFDEVVPSEAVRSMEAAKKCGYNRVVIAPSTIEGAGLGLFLRRDKVTAGGLITSYYRGKD
jgi:hypothetical protein